MKEKQETQLRDTQAMHENMISSLKQQIQKTQQENERDMQLRDEMNREQARREQQVHESELAKSQQQIATLEQLLMNKEQQMMEMRQ